MTIYTPVAIAPTHSGFGMYQSDHNTVRYVGIVETEVGKGYFDKEEIE